MNTKKFRWLQVLGLIVIASLVLAFVRPGSVSEVNAKAGSPTTVTVYAKPNARHARLASLANTPIKVNKASISDMFGSNSTLFGAGTDLPFIELNYNKRLPKVFPPGSATGGLNGAQTDGSAARPMAEIDRARYTDAPLPGLNRAWEGLNQGSNRTLFTFGFLPSDSNGDTSGNVYDSGYYIETVNGTIAIWDYSKLNVYGSWPKTVYGPAPINTMFTGMGGPCETTNDGDPIVLFDEVAGRWLVSQFAVSYTASGPYSECIAVSQGKNPLMGWNLYEFTFANMPDYPKIGIWPDGYYMTVNQFIGGTTFGGAGIAVFDRTAMLAGLPAKYAFFDSGLECSKLLPADLPSPLCGLGGMLPGDADGAFPPLGTLNVIAQVDDDAWSSPPNFVYPVDQLELWNVSVDWTALPEPVATLSLPAANVLPVTPFDSNLCLYARNCLVQPGTAVGLDAISDRLMNRLQFRNFGAYQTLVTNHTVDVNGANQAGIRWYELRNTGGAGWTVNQQGNYAPDANSRWMGSIAMDAVGNIALGYSVTGAAVFPSIRYTGREKTDALNTMRLVESGIAVGGGSQTSTASRWGDYSSMSVAPDGCDFVYVNQYLRGTTSAEWYTRMGNFRFASCLTKGDAMGVFRPTTGALYIKYGNFTGVGDLAINYGIPGDVPVAGDWDADLTDTIGVYRAGKFYLRNSNTTGIASIPPFFFGVAGDQPIAGDWNGDGMTTIGVYRSATGTFSLRNSNTAGAADAGTFVLGSPGDIAVAGDWNNDGIDTVGLFRPSVGKFFLKNTNSTGPVDLAILFGAVGDLPVAGDWNGDGTDTIGVYRNGLVLLRNANSAGAADMSFYLGGPGDRPYAGDWNIR